MICPISFKTRISRSRFLRGTGSQSLSKIPTRRRSDSFPILTLALNYYFGEFDVFGYHLVNLLIHVAAGIFLYWFLLLTFNLPSLEGEIRPHFV